MADAPPARVRMVPEEVVLDGRRWRYAVSDNEPAADGPEVWALNLHGYLAAGSMYWRESARLAGALGWRVVNPSMPGFGGSDPLPWESLSLGAMAGGLAALLDHVGARRVVVLGHSMGGAIAVRFATDHPERTLGVIYRNGAATPSWKERGGPVVAVLSPASPDLAALVDIVGAAVADLPDLAIGRVRSTIRGVWPDFRRNTRSLGLTVPVAAMLFACDLSDDVAALGRSDLPFLPVWGRFDRVTPVRTAHEVEALTGRQTAWVTGGHSWMLARPGSQGALLRAHALGQDFLEAVTARSARATLALAT